MKTNYWTDVVFLINFLGVALAFNNYVMGISTFEIKSIFLGASLMFTLCYLSDYCYDKAKGYR